MRIVSLLPSATEIICALGLRDHLVGVSHGCDYPDSVIGLPVVTKSNIPQDAASDEIDQQVRRQLEEKIALYSMDINRLEELQADIIVTQGLCEVCAVFEADINKTVCHLSKQPKIINLEPMCLDDMFSTLELVGKETGYEDKAYNLIDLLNKRVERVRLATYKQVSGRQPSIAFLEWINPPFNSGHWTPELIEIAGGIDCFSNKHRSSKTILWQDIIDAQPDIMFIACCGLSVDRAMKDFPILQSQQGWDNLPCVKNNRVYFADGNAYFNRPGPRLIDSLEIIANTLHPNVHSIPIDIPAAVRV